VAVEFNKDLDPKAERTNKNGRWTKEEEDYMVRNHKIMSIEDLACQLQRNPKTVYNYVKDKLNFGKEVFKETKKDLEFDIKKSPIWKQISEQFSPNELDTFLYHYANLVSQFNYDVFATERLQIIEFCRIEILINRALKKMNDVGIQINEIDREVDLEYKFEESERDQQKIIRLKELRASMNVSAINYTKDYKELLDKKGTLLREVKGTRADRIKRIEDSKETIGTYLASLMDNTEMRRALGIEMEKFRLATKIEYQRLSDYHTYIDGSVEQPILNTENIKEDNN
jgi:hypothetical protein